MSAGSIPAPQIIPLRLPQNQTKTNISTNTYISITCSYNQAHSVFFTFDGTKPQIRIEEGRSVKGPNIRLKPETNGTLKFDQPFLLSNGRRTVRAIAISHIDGRQSNIVSKVFNVEYVEPDSSDGEEFSEENLQNEHHGGSDGQGSMYSDNAENFKLELNERKKLRDQWGNSFNFQPTVSNGLPQQTAVGYYPAPQQPVVYANPDSLDFGGMQIAQMPGTSQVLAQNMGNSQLFPGASQTMPGQQMSASNLYAPQTLYSEFKTEKESTKHCKNRSTQTVGLFYPGGKRMQAEEQRKLEEEFTKMKNKSDTNLVSPISPGKGYWRKQVDHINGHLRAYAQQNLEFRSLIADQRFGNIQESSIDERTDQITVSFTFSLHGINEKPKSGGVNYENSSNPTVFGSRITRGLSNPTTPTATRRSKSSSGNKNSASAAISRRPNQSPEPRLPRGRSPVQKTQNPVDRLFLKELGGRARLDEIEQLISEGADPNCVDFESEKSALGLTVENLNASVEVVERVIQLGAKMNEPYGKNSDTVLHLAVAKENRYRRVLKKT